jgi:hypothetical protein
MLRMFPDLNLRELGEVSDSWLMKLLRTLFHTTVFLLILVVFSHPVRALTDTSFALPAPETDTSPAHLSALTILAELGSGFIDGVVILLLVFLIGLTFWLVLPAPRAKRQAAMQLPIEVPPLRVVPHRRVTKF